MHRKDKTFVFFVALTFYLVGRCFEYTIWSESIVSFTKTIKNLAYITLIPCIFHSVLISIRKNNIKKFGPVLLILILYFLFLLIFGVNSGFVCFGFSFASIDLKKDKLFKYLKKVLIFLFISVIFISLVTNTNTISTRAFGERRNRYSFGFRNPYSMQMLWMSIVSCSILIKRKKNICYIGFLLIITYMLHLLGNVRTAFISTVFLILFDYLLEKKYKTQKMKMSRFKWFPYIYTVCFLLFNSLCWIHFSHPNYITLSLDFLFTGRISMTARLIKYVCNGSIPIYPIRSVDFDLKAVAALPTLALDSSYADWLFIDGFFFSILTLTVLFLFSRNVFIKKDLSLIVILIASALNGCLQQTVMSLLYNPVILLTCFYITQIGVEKKASLIEKRSNYAKQ